MSDSVRPHRWQLTRLCHPWDSAGKNTGVGCHFLLQCIKVKSEVAQSCPSPNTAWRTEWYCHCMRALLPEGCPLRVPLGNVSRPWKVLPSPHHLLGAFSWPLWAPILPLHRQCTSRIFHNDSSAVPYSSQCSVTPEPSKCDYCHGRAAFSVFI